MDTVQKYPHIKDKKEVLPQIYIFNVFKDETSLLRAQYMYKNVYIKDKISCPKLCF